jgi:hypothetical protein
MLTELKTRLKSETPDWFKKARKIGIYMSSIAIALLGASAITPGFVLPHVLETPCQWLAVCGISIAAVSTTAKKDQVMKNLMIILVCLFAASCSRKIVPHSDTVVKENTVEKIVYVKKDSLVKMPGDSVTLHDTIPCPGVVYHKEAVSKNGTLKTTVDIKDGRLDVGCKADSLQARIEWLEVHGEKVITKTQTTTITPPAEKYIPKWVKWLIAITGLYIIARLFIWRYKIPLSL